MRYLGIDPGTTGAACVFCPEASAASGMRWQIIDMPMRGEKSGQRLDAKALRDWITRLSPHRGVIELVNPMPRQGSVTTGLFIGVARAIEAVVECCGVPMQSVPPAVWKSGLLVPRVEKTPSQTASARTRLLKQASRRYAMRRFPELAPQILRVMDADRAEAALMAYYAYSTQSPELTDPAERENVEVDHPRRRA